MPHTVAQMRTTLAVAVALIGHSAAQAQDLEALQILVFGGSGDDYAASVDAYPVMNPVDVVFGGSYSAGFLLPGPNSSMLDFPHTGALDSFAARYSPGQTFVDWRMIANGSMRQEGPGVHALADGRIAFTTAAEGESVIAAGEPEELTIISDGGSFDPVVCMLTEDGILTWTDWIFGPLTSLVRGFSSTSGGSLWVNVYGRGEMTAGAGTPTEYMHTRTDDKFDTMLLRYSAAGEIEFGRSNGGTNDDFYYASAGDALNQVFIAGQFETNSILSSGLPDATTLTSVGGDDIQAAAYNANGQLMWARSYGSAGDDIALSMTYIGGGDLLMCGSVSSGAAFANVGGGVTNIATRGGIDGFYARVRASDGRVRWARGIGGIGSDTVLDGMRLLGGDDLGVIVGTFENSLIYNTTSLFTSRGGTDVFVATINLTTGNLVGDAIQIGGTGADSVGEACVLTNQRVVLAGSYSNTLTIGPTGTFPTVTSNGGIDGFVLTLGLPSPSSASESWMLLE
jgi:hypothetical protein